MGRKNKRTENLEKREQQRQQQLAINRKQKLLKITKWTVSIVVVIIAVVFLFRTTTPPVGDFEPLSLTSIAPTDHVKGNPDASILIVEYSSLQCPACAFYAPQVSAFIEQYGDEVAFVFRHFPLKQIHRNAVEAARATEAAARQGAFWEMKDLIFENQNEWSNLGSPRALFRQYAVELGLDGDQFMSDIRDPEIAGIVEHSYRSAVGYNFRGTPTFILNGQQTTFENIVAQFQ